ncbi:hypothetical protein [Pseudomonas luteola]|uniref:Carbohydrate-binding protein n=1 Tax=Pseudomonas luteola TaxID=47886 RepID=A0ABS0MUW5_PSELU|nr:hypothetical protein [Pseudomonas luteola]MBH3440549.1 hypothetical protein [Pseudomonas luteola]
MRVIKPAAITDSSLTASNVAEDDADAWASGGSYSTGQRVIDNHHIYEWLGSTAGNTATPPSKDTSVPAKWLDTGATNRWKMFDKKAGNKYVIGQATSNPDLIDITIRPGEVVNSIGLFGVQGSSVQITMTDPSEGVVYDKTISLADTGVNNWYDYWFAPFDRNETLVRFDLPAYGTADIRVVVSYPNSTAAVGLLVLGASTEIGTAVWGTAFGYQSYSKTEEDDFGNITITPRGSRRYVDFDVRIDTPQIDRVARFLDRLRSVPAVYVGTSSMESTIVMGVYDSLNPVISNPAFCEMTLEVRSLQ